MEVRNQQVVLIELEGFTSNLHARFLENEKLFMLVNQFLPFQNLKFLFNMFILSNVS